MKILKKTLGIRNFFDGTTLFLHYIGFQHIFKHLSYQTGYRYVYDKWLFEKARPRVSRNVLYIYLWKRWKLKWLPQNGRQVQFCYWKWLFRQFLKMIMQKPEGPRPKLWLTVQNDTETTLWESFLLFSYNRFFQIVPTNLLWGSFIIEKIVKTLCFTVSTWNVCVICFIRPLCIKKTALTYFL